MDEVHCTALSVNAVVLGKLLCCVGVGENVSGRVFYFFFFFCWGEGGGMVSSAYTCIKILVWFSVQLHPPLSSVILPSCVAVNH